MLQFKFQTIRIAAFLVHFQLYFLFSSKYAALVIVQVGLVLYALILRRAPNLGKPKLEMAHGFPLFSIHTTVTYYSSVNVL